MAGSVVLGASGFKADPDIVLMIAAHRCSVTSVTMYRYRPEFGIYLASDAEVEHVPVEAGEAEQTRWMKSAQP